MVFAVSELKSAQKLQFLDQNPQFSSKSAIFVKICSFHQNLQFSSKSTVFAKICSFCQNPRFSSKSTGFHQNLWFLAFHSEFSRGQHQIGILCETKDHLPRKVTPIF